MLNKKKIIYVVPTLGLGGTESQLFFLVKNIKDRFDITVCCLYQLGTFAERMQNIGVKIECLNLLSIWDLRVVTRFTKLVLKNKYDIIHSFLFDSTILTIPLARVLGIRCLISSPCT